MGKPIDPDNPCSVEANYATEMMAHMTKSIGVTGAPVKVDGMSSMPLTRAAPTKIKLDARVAATNKISGDMPQYPPIAKAAHIQGTVVLQAIISKEGTIEELQIVSGPPLLQQAALDAVKTWRYRPYLVMGEPVQVETLILFNFGTGVSAGQQQQQPANPTQP